MTRNMIHSALTEVSGLPVHLDQYSGTEQSYITYSVRVNPLAYGDDVPAIGYLSIRVDYYTPLNSDPDPMIRAIRTVLMEMGCTWPTQDFTDIEDGTVRRIAFECESEVQGLSEWLDS